MEKRLEAFEIASGLSVGGGRMLVVAGPCVVESHEVCLETALRLQEITQKLDVGYVFKASFDKANRTASRSFRSLGFAEALEILQAVGKAASAPVLTDIHETWQVKPAAEAAAYPADPGFPVPADRPAGGGGQERAGGEHQARAIHGAGGHGVRSGEGELGREFTGDADRARGKLRLP